MSSIGLCLSGGGARGIFHIGVLQALEEKNIRPAVMSGTSAGALIGVLYSAGCSAKEIFQIASEANWFKFITPQLPNGGLIGMEYLEGLLKEHLLHDAFESLQIPIRVTACNLSQGKLEIFESGPVIQAVLASCSVPMLFKPVNMGADMYLDGGILSNLPAGLIRHLCERLIGVSLTPIVAMEHDALSSSWKILNRVLELTIDNNTSIDRAMCDLIIESPRIAAIPKYKLGEAAYLHQLGYETGIKALENFL